MSYPSTLWPQLDYLELIQRMIGQIREAGEPEVAELVNDRFTHSFTSSELLMSVTHELLGIVTEDERLRNIIGTDVQKLKDYC